MLGDLSVHDTLGEGVRPGSIERLTIVEARPIRQTFVPDSLSRPQLFLARDSKVIVNERLFVTRLFYILNDVVELLLSVFELLFHGFHVLQL